MKRAKMIFAIAFILFGLIACEREERGFRVTTPDGRTIDGRIHHIDDVRILRTDTDLFEIPAPVPETFVP